MKKILVIIAVAVLPLVAHAQFEQGKIYAGAGLTSLNLSYSGQEELSLGLQGQGGYFMGAIGSKLYLGTMQLFCE